MRTILLLVISSMPCFAQLSLPTLNSSWEPLKFAARAGIVSDYWSGDSGSIRISSGVAIQAVSNRVFKISGGTTNQTLFAVIGPNQPVYTNTSTGLLGGYPTIYFNGTQHYLKSAAFTLAQPEEVYVLMIPITWTQFDRIFDGNLYNSSPFYQNIATPTVQQYAGTAQVSDNSDMAVGSWALAQVCYNGTSSYIKINGNSPTTGSPGSDGLGGFTLGTRGNFSDWFANMQVARVIICSKTNATEESSYLRWGMLKQAGLN